MATVRDCFIPPLPITDPGTVEIISLDFDGSIFNAKFYRGEHKGNVIRSNWAFILMLCERIEKNKPDLIIFVFFTGRRSYRTDVFCGDKPDPVSGIRSGSCFPQLILICNIVKKLLRKKGILTPCVICKALMPDFNCDLPPGYSFDRAIEAEPKRKKLIESKADQSEIDELIAQHPVSIFDTNKLDMAFVLSQFFSWLFPKANILKSCYDDREDIILKLGTFLGKRPQMIPKNVLLHLRKYDGSARIWGGQIQGTGQRDNEFKDTLKRMIKLAGIDRYNLQSFGVEHDLVTFYEQNPEKFNELMLFMTKAGSVVPHSILSPKDTEPEKPAEEIKLEPQLETMSNILMSS